MSLKISRKPSAVQVSVMMGALHKLVQVTNRSAAAHIQCTKTKVLMLTRQPAFPSCHHLLHISSSLLFLAQRSVEKTEIKQVVTWEMRAALCVGPRHSATGVASLGRIKHLAFVTPHPLYNQPHPQSWYGRTYGIYIHGRKKKKKNTVFASANNFPGKTSFSYRETHT